MSLSWPTAEAAIVAWVAGALSGVSGLTPIWAHQRNPFVVPPPVVVLAISRAAAADRGDAVDYLDLSQVGQEIELETTRFWLCTLLVEIRTANDDVVGQYSPHALAADLLTALRQESVQEALAIAGVGLVDDDGDIEFEPELFKNTWQPRATFTVRFYVATSRSERTGFIDNYAGTLVSPPAANQAVTFFPEEDL